MILDEAQAAALVEALVGTSGSDSSRPRRAPQPLRADDREESSTASLARHHWQITSITATWINQVDAEDEPGEGDRRPDRGRLDPGRERGREDREVGDEAEDGDRDPGCLRVLRVLDGLAAAGRARELRAVYRA